MGITMLHIDAITFLTKVVILTLQSNNFSLAIYFYWGKNSSPFYCLSFFTKLKHDITHHFQFFFPKSKTIISF